MAKIFLNPGHCIGIDSGAVNPVNGAEEANICYSVACKVEEYLKNAGCSVYTLQSNNLCGEYPAHPNIVATANELDADIFISLHCNAFNEQAKGTECLVFAKGSYSSENLAKAIQNQIVNSLNTIDRGIKERPDLAVLRGTAMTAVLVEMAFIDNAEDCHKLITKQDEFARAIARGVTDYLQGGEM